MSIIRTQDHRLLLHAPTVLSPELRGAVARLGQVAWILAPNRRHQWWLAEWLTSFPEARAFVAPGPAEQTDQAGFPVEMLGRSVGCPWDEAALTLPVIGPHVVEIVLFHRASRTLILTDLIESFVRRGWWARIADKIMRRGEPAARCYAPTEVQSAITTMMALKPERILVAHGSQPAQDAADELLRTLRPGCYLASRQ
jgi:hypothetical protein